LVLYLQHSSDHGSSTRRRDHFLLVRPRGESHSAKVGAMPWRGSAARAITVAGRSMVTLTRCTAVPTYPAGDASRAPDTAQYLARGVLRAVVESAPSHWFIQRRHGRRTLLAVNGDAIADAGPEQTALARLDPPARHLLARFNAAALLDMAVALGDRANALVDATTPLVASSDATESGR